MMELSIVIVSYNVSHFLEQCLDSVMRAMQGIEGEIIVVDNHSVDNSVEMVRRRFSSIKIIETGSNLGFAKANNIGIIHSEGKYILLLNPDTIVGEDCLLKCLDFMKRNPDAGALGVKMLDGQGKILPESKRGFPTLWISFCKLTGLYKLFPNSRIFNGYYMGHLDYEHDHRIDILTGAFFFTKSSVLKQIGGLDERYFMYGEDIDLSYSIQQLGYSIYYYAGTSIIHFKGESTRKSNLSYWNSFFGAMMLFYDKYYGNRTKSLSFFIKLAIIIRGVVGFGRQLLNRAVPILADITFLLLGFYTVKIFWSLFFHGTPYYFQTQAIWFNAGLYCMIWMITLFLNGVYDHQSRLMDLVVSNIIALIASLSIYALIPELLRSSRMLPVLLFLWMLVYLVMSRLLVNKFKIAGVNSVGGSMLIIGNDSEEDQVRQILKKHQKYIPILNRVDQNHSFDDHSLADAISVFKADQLILCPSIGSAVKMIDIMSQVPEEVEIRILTASGSGIIGSTDKNQQGELMTFDLTYNLQKIRYRRQKRFFDVMFSLLVLFFSWILVFFQKNKGRFFLNIVHVVLGLKTWVNPRLDEQAGVVNPVWRPGVVEPLNEFQQAAGKEFVEEVYKNYLWNYSIWMDLDICIKEINHLDRKAHE